MHYNFGKQLFRSTDPLNSSRPISRVGPQQHLCLSWGWGWLPFMQCFLVDIANVTFKFLSKWCKTQGHLVLIRVLYTFHSFFLKLFSHMNLYFPGIKGFMFHWCLHFFRHRATSGYWTQPNVNQTERKLGQDSFGWGLDSVYFEPPPFPLEGSPPIPTLPVMPCYRLLPAWLRAWLVAAGHMAWNLSELPLQFCPLSSRPVLFNFSTPR